MYGDAFTQSTFRHLRQPQYEHSDHYGQLNEFQINGWGFGVMDYAQNRVNGQMRYPNNGNPNSIPPALSPDQWTNTNNTIGQSYSQSYTPRNGITISAAYNPNIPEHTRFPTRIIYSQTKPNGSNTDEYRVIRPLDFRDLDMVNGEIVHHEFINGELLTWQQRSFQRQYFNSNG